MRIDRLDKGESMKPTVSVNPGEGGLYTGRRKENLFTKDQKTYTKQGKVNYDRIFRGGDGETEVEGTLDRHGNDGARPKTK